MDREPLWALFRETGMPAACALYLMLTEDAQDE